MFLLGGYFPVLSVVHAINGGTRVLVQLDAARRQLILLASKREPVGSSNDASLVAALSIHCSHLCAAERNLDCSASTPGHAWHVTSDDRLYLLIAASVYANRAPTQRSHQ